MSAEIIAHLLDEMEEYYGAFDYYPLYLLGWQLNDGRRTAEEKHDSGSAGVRRVHLAPFHQGRLGPVADRLGAGRPLAPGTPLDFDLDPDSPTDIPMQVLVPD